MQKENKALKAKLKEVKEMIYSLDRSEIETGSEVEEIAIEKLKDGHTTEFVAFHHHLTNIVHTIIIAVLGDLTDDEEQELVDNMYSCLEAAKDKEGLNSLMLIPTHVILLAALFLISEIQGKRGIVNN